MSVSKAIGRFLLPGALLILSASSFARPQYLVLVKQLYPPKVGGAIDKAGCLLCHGSPGPPKLNPFGASVRDALDAAKTTNLSAKIFQSVLIADSDKDGFSNGDEIQGDTLPGDPASHPAAHKPAGPSAAQVGGASIPAGSFSAQSVMLPKNAQHPALIHFPIALFIGGVILDLLASWKQKPAWALAGFYNLVLSAFATLPALITGLLAWQIKEQGMALQGTILLHLILAVTSSVLIWTLLIARRKTELPDQPVRNVWYFVFALVGVLLLAATGHLGGMLSGVAG